MILSSNEIKNQYGLKIYNYEAGSIFACNLGTRKDYNKTEAMLANSLFSDFLKENKLKTYHLNWDETSKSNKWIEDKNGNWTRDVICIKFETGTKSYDDEINFFEKKKEEKKVEFDERTKEFIQEVEELKVDKSYEAMTDDECERAIKDISLEYEQVKKDYNNSIAFFDELRKLADENKDKFVAKSKEELRIDYYKNGVEIRYSDICIKYKMLYRTAGKAKEGSCMFIREELYDKARNYLRMGKEEFQNEEARIVEIGAYQSLVASNIVGKVIINPENILVIKDVDVSFDRNVVSVLSLLKYKEKDVLDDDIKNKMVNTLFDGQALIDSSVFDKSVFFSNDEKLNGYILLRQHFCKMAAFCTDIKLFFKDYCEEHNLDYETFTVKDIWNKDHFVKDIELITTQNAMKWMKFGEEYKDFKYWCKQVRKNDGVFGIVKTAHESKQGEFQRMSYQMVNALCNDENKLKQVIQCSLEYLDKLKRPDDDFVKDELKNIEDNEFIKFLKKNSTFSNDYEILIELCKQDRTFLQSEYFRDRKRQIIHNYTKELRGGRIIQNAENLVIVGSPLAMLLAAAGDDPLKDSMFELETGEYPAIQCFTERFADGVELAEFRSPFNSKNNLGYMRNRYPEAKIRKYFNRFGKQIIAVNMIGTDFQARNNGSDQDSDSIYTTDESIIVDCAKSYYKEYPTIINDILSIPGQDKEYADILDKYADIDNKLSNAQREIGESSNLAQLCLTYSYSFPKDRQNFEDDVCILSVLAQIAIDKAKRNFDIKSEDEIKRIRRNMDIEDHNYPKFWKVLENRSSKNYRTGKSKNINEDLVCPMNYIYCLEPKKKYKSNFPSLSMECFFNPYTDSDNKATRKETAVEKLIEEYGLGLLINEDDGEDEYDSYLLLRSDFEEMLNEIKRRKLNTYRLSSILIDRAFCITAGQKRNSEKIKAKTNKNKSLLLKTLYRIDPDGVLKCFSKNLIKDN